MPETADSARALKRSPARLNSRPSSSRERALNSAMPWIEKSGLEPLEPGSGAVSASDQYAPVLKLALSRPSINVTALAPGTGSLLQDMAKSMSVPSIEAPGSCIQASALFKGERPGFAAQMRSRERKSSLEPRRSTAPRARSRISERKAVLSSEPSSSSRGAPEAEAPIRSSNFDMAKGSLNKKRKGRSPLAGPPPGKISGPSRPGPAAAAARPASPAPSRRGSLR